MDVVLRFIYILTGIVAAVVVGYQARKRGWIDESFAGPLMFYTVIIGWTPASMFVLWQLPLVQSLIVLPLISALISISLAPFGYLFARFHRLDSQSAGTYIVAAGTSNIGFTMGGFVCYILFSSVGQGLEALGYANLFAASWVIPYIGLYYTLARRFGDPDSRLTVGFVLRTLFDFRSLPMLGTIAGLALNLLAVPMPQALITFHIIDLLIVLSVLLSFAIIGLQLHPEHLSQKPRLNASLALIKFAIAPILMVLMLTLLQLLFGRLPDTARKVVYVQSFMPSAIFTVVISNLFNLNPRLAAALFLINTVLFLVLILPILAFFVLSF